MSFPLWVPIDPCLSCPLPAKLKAADLELSIPLLFALPPEKLH